MRIKCTPDMFGLSSGVWKSYLGLVGEVRMVVLIRISHGEPRSPWSGDSMAIDLSSTTCSAHYFGESYSIKRVASSPSWGHCCRATSLPVNTMINLHLLLSPLPSMCQTPYVYFFEVYGSNLVDEVHRLPYFFYHHRGRCQFSNDVLVWSGCFDMYNSWQCHDSWTLYLYPHVHGEAWSHMAAVYMMAGVTGVK